MYSPLFNVDVENVTKTPKSQGDVSLRDKPIHGLVLIRISGDFAPPCGGCFLSYKIEVSSLGQEFNRRVKTQLPKWSAWVQVPALLPILRGSEQKASGCVPATHLKDLD